MIDLSEKLDAVSGRGAAYKYLRVILLCLTFLFAVSLFKNISYPLFWADESMTVMHGKRVLEFGYPKVHDGKNVLYDLRHSNSVLGLDEKTDAFIGGANWGQYYVAAIGVKMAEMSDDIYVKTGTIRSLFALIGFAGLSIFAFVGSKFFSRSLSKAGFLSLFIFLELISVPLVLHLREARYYPLTVFLVALAILIYTHYRILNNTKQASFVPLLTVALFLLFLVFSPAYLILLAAILLFESLSLARRFFLYRQRIQKEVPPQPCAPKELFTDFLKGMLPLILSLIAVYPLMIFFKISYIAEEMTKFNTLTSNTDSLHMYLENLSIIWSFFASSDYIYLAIFLKIGLLVCFALRLFYRMPLVIDMPKAAFSNFLTVFFIIYFFAIAKIPNFLFTRYFIPLQPVLALIIILDLAIIFNVLSQYRSAAISRSVLTTLFIGFVSMNVSQNIEFISGHIYEVTHPYKGPLDYAIPYIKEKYSDTERLVIATNYEETSFMYYLNAKVIVGFVGNNLEEDSRAIPDIVLYRKGWGDFTNNFSSGGLFSEFLKRGRYMRISLPIVDHPTNNIPELNWSPPYVHRFRSVETRDERTKLDIYLRM